MAMMAAAPVATVASIRTTWQLAMSGGSRRKCSWRQEGGRRGRGEGEEGGGGGGERGRGEGEGGGGERGRRGRREEEGRRQRRMREK